MKIYTLMNFINNNHMITTIKLENWINKIFIKTQVLNTNLRLFYNLLILGIIYSQLNINQILFLFNLDLLAIIVATYFRLLIPFYNHQLLNIFNLNKLYFSLLTQKEILNLPLIRLFIKIKEKKNQKKVKTTRDFMKIMIFIFKIKL